MSYDREHLYLTWGGSLGTSSGPEIWQNGVRIMAPVGDPTPGMPDATSLQDVFDNGLSPLHSAATFVISNHAWLQWVKAVKIGTDGAYAGEPVSYSATAVAGGSTVTSSRTGMQDSTVISLWSGLTLGKANYGRIYTPWSESTVDQNTGRVPSVTTDFQAALAADMIGYINTWATGLPNPGLVAIMSKIGSGVSKYVNYVRVGDVRDTQRRRRDGIAETYSQVAL